MHNFQNKQNPTSVSQHLHSVLVNVNVLKSDEDVDDDSYYLRGQFIVIEVGVFLILQLVKNLVLAL